MRIPVSSCSYRKGEKAEYLFFTICKEKKRYTKKKKRFGQLEEGLKTTHTVNMCKIHSGWKETTASQPQYVKYKDEENIDQQKLIKIQHCD
jgi:hypothetical protein